MPALKELTPKVISKLDDKELLSVHRRLHQWWANPKINRELIINAHAFVVREMLRRGFKHNAHDELDRETQNLLEHATRADEYGPDYFGPGLVEMTAQFASDFGAVYEHLVPNRVLEIGCGSGRALELLQRDGWDIVGVDISDTAIELSKQRNVEVVVADAHDLPFGDDSFDSCFSMHLLEHVDDPAAVCAESLRVAPRAVHLVPLGVRADSRHKHTFKSLDELRRVLPPARMSKAPGNVAVVVLERGFDSIAALDSFVIVPDYISLVGGAVKRNDPDDIDILVRDDMPDSSLAVRLRNQFPDDAQDKLHFIWNAKGPHDDYLPLYDLVAVRKNYQMQSIALRRLEPIAHFRPLKTRGGYSMQEFYDLEKLWEFWAQGVLSEGIAVEQKFSGWRTIFQLKGGKPFIYFEDHPNRDKSKIMPNIAKQLQKVGLDVILDAELGEYVNGKPVDRKDLARWGQVTTPQDDSRVIVHVFDCLYWRGEDLHEKPWIERQRALDDVMDKLRGTQFKRVKPIIVKSKKALFEAIRKVAKMPGSEGAVLKVVTSDYPLTGQTSSWAKIKTVVEVHARVVDKERNKAGLWVYTCESADGTILGKTLATKLDQKVGGLLTVTVQEIILDKDGKPHWVVPKPVDLSTTHTKPDSDATIIKRAKEAGILQGEERGQTGESEAAMRAPANPRWDYKVGDTGVFVLQEHQIGEGAHLDLRLHRKGDEHLEGFTLATPGRVGGRNKLLEPRGNEKVLVPSFKPPQPLAWLKVGEDGPEHPAEFDPGEVGARTKAPGKMWRLDYGKWTMTANDPHFIQFKFEGDKLKGLYNLTSVPRPKEWERAGESKRVWLFSKGAERKEEQAETRLPINIMMADTEEQVVTGVVLAPGEPDSRRRFAREEEIKRACWLYMHSQAVYENHDTNLNEEVRLVENYIAPVDFEMTNPVTKETQRVPKGSWVVSMKIENPAIWRDIKAGRYTGFSMRAFVEQVPVRRTSQ